MVNEEVKSFDLSREDEQVEIEKRECRETTSWINAELSSATRAELSYSGNQ